MHLDPTDAAGPLTSSGQAAAAGPDEVETGGWTQTRAAPRSVAALGWVLGRVVVAAATALAASALIWSLLPLAPGDPAARLLAADGVVNASPDELAAVRERLGLDRPLPVQFAAWLADVGRGDLGRSYLTGRPVLSELAQRMPATLRLTVLGLLLSLLGAVPTALAAAWFRDRPLDHIARVVAVLGYAVPSFVLGVVVVQVVVLRFGRFTVIADTGWRSALLPACCLAVPALAHWSRLLRAGLIDGERSEHSRVAAARGASRLRILLTHALPGAAVPLLTAVGLWAGVTLGGAAVIETVFGRPGVGEYLVERITERDLPAIQAFTLLATLGYVAINLGVDLVAGAIDPRRRTPHRA